MPEDNKERRQVHQVAHGTKRKETVLDKAGRLLLAEDARTVGEVMIEDYIIPSIKNAALSAFEMLLFGSTSKRGRTTDVGHTPYYSYSSSQSTYGANRVDTRLAPRSNRFDYVDYEFDTLDDVMIVIEELSALIREYGYARVADCHQSIGISGNYTDGKWGWTDVRDLRWARRGSRYILNFAPPIPLDN